MISLLGSVNSWDLVVQININQVDYRSHQNRKPVELSYNIFSGTIRNWLHICGFRVQETKKGLYYDGHERDDVVKVNQKFLVRARLYTHSCVSGGQWCMLYVSMV